MVLTPEQFDLLPDKFPDTVIRVGETVALLLASQPLTGCAPLKRAAGLFI
jgi:hypothetical protein